MEKVTATFRLLRDIHLADLFGAVGVYVLWSEQDHVRPTYVGEGELLKRFASHAEWLKPPCDGYLAITGDWHQKDAKINAQIVEAALLAVCDETLRFPVENAKAGSRKHIRKVLSSHLTLRVAIRGYDPLQNPLRPSRVRGQRAIAFKEDVDGPNPAKWDWPKLRGA